MTLRDDFEAASTDYESAYLDGDGDRMTKALARQVTLLRDMTAEALKAEDDPEQRDRLRRYHITLAHLVEHGQAILKDDDGTSLQGG